MKIFLEGDWIRFQLYDKNNKELINFTFEKEVGRMIIEHIIYIRLRR